MGHLRAIELFVVLVLHVRLARSLAGKITGRGRDC
jgi:hypothetical protein